MMIDRTSDAASNGPDLVRGERELVEAAAAGDHEAFGALVLLHERVAVRTALAALGRIDEAEDVAQDAFLLAWRKLPHFRGDAAFRTWLLTIVWRQALAKRRGQQRWWRRAVTVGDGTNDDVERFVAHLASPDPSPEQRAVDRGQAGAVAAAIATLSPKLRDTLLLAASGEHGYEDIGRMLGVATGTVKWRVSEARRLVTLRMEGGREP